LAAAVYYEAADQPLQGQEAVAQVVLNRVRHIAYPKSVCGVIYEGATRPGCQFTFACDGSLGRPPRGQGWRTAVGVAEQALDGFVEPSVGASTHYHTVYVHPVWDDTMRMVRRIGAHQFYRFNGAMGQASALAGAYAGEEPDVAILATSTRAQIPKLGRAARLNANGPSARPAAFSVWGLQVALVRPSGDSVSVSLTSRQRAAADKSVQPGPDL
jgi:hypothetical protein